MRSDLTLIYYTANVIDDGWATRVRERLEATGLPMVCVSQKPLGDSAIVVGEIGATPYNLYKQILLGASAAETEYVACCEDDTLYSDEHFAFAPPRDDTFYYNRERWWLEPSGSFRFRDRESMCACVVSRDLLVQTLETRFAKYPECPGERWAWRHFGEPGRVESRMNLPPVLHEQFQTQQVGVITFNHRDSLGGRRKVDPSERLIEELPGWGHAAVLWEEVHG